MAENEIVKKEDKQQLVAVDDSEFNCYLDTAKFNQLYRAATLLASTEIIPTRYQKKPADCFVAMQMAIRMKSDPIMLMQNTYIIQGKPGMEAKYVIAMMNCRGPFKGPVQWEFKGQGATRSCTAYATHKITNEVCKATVTWDMAEKEGWTKKAGSKWLTMPDLMFQYRSASFLANLYCPEVKMGMMTVDEIIDIVPESPSVEVQKGVNGVKEKLGILKTEAIETVEESIATVDKSDKKEERAKTIKEQAKKLVEENNVPIECRYVCIKCDHESDGLGLGGVCVNCGSTDVTDRRPE